MTNAMLVEGIDDSVFVSFTILIVLSAYFLTTAMIDYLRSRRVSGTPDAIHRDSLNDLTQFRNQVMNATTSAAGAATGTGNFNSRRYTQDSQITCPICLAVAVLPIETNCKHCFCSSCIVQYWRHITHENYFTKITCPICRQNIIYMLPLFSINDDELRRSTQFIEVINLVNSYNKRFSGSPRSFWDHVSELPLLLRHLFNEFFTFRNIELWHQIRFGFLILVAFCYFLAPFDVFPEALFGVLGFVDDLMVVLFMSLYVCALYRQVFANRN